MFRAGLYTRVSTNDQQTLSMQSHAMRRYAARRGCRPPTRYTDGCFGPDTLTFDVSLIYTQP